MRLPRPGALALELVAVLLLSVAIQVIQLRVVGLGNDSDGAVYLHYASEWGSGQAPYRDFMPEYPPGAMFFMAMPYLVAGGDIGAYRFELACEMAVFDSAAALLVLLAAWKLWPRSRLRRILAVGLYLGATVALSRLVHRRFDVAVSALALAGLLAPPVAGGAFLGVATAAKLWPAALLPITALAGLRKNGLAGTLRPALGFVLGLGLTVLPFLPRAGAGVVRFFDYHAERGIQVESSWALAAFSLDSLGVAPARCTWEHGADHVASAAAAWMRPASTVATAVLSLLPLLVLLVWRRERAGRLDTQICTATAVVAGLLLGGKVLSPQYFLWIAPLAALGALHGRWPRALPAAVAAAAIPVLTTLVYLVYYTPLCNGNRAVAIPVAVTRFVLLGLLYVLMLTARAAPAAPLPARPSG